MESELTVKGMDSKLSRWILAAAQQGTRELVDELLREGVGDPERVAIYAAKGGHGI